MNLLLINVPSRKGKTGFMLPLGLLYVVSIAEKAGVKAKIIDLYLYDTDEWLQRLNEAIKEFRPSVIGFGGIATSYAQVKGLSEYLKKQYPGMVQIAGGPLASTYELLLTKNYVDVVFHGEVETTLPQFLAKAGNINGHVGVNVEICKNIKGISYKENDKIVRNPSQEQVKDLDSIPFPAYHSIDVSKYLCPIKGWIESNRMAEKDGGYFKDLIKTIGNKEYYIPIVSSRGCTNKCSFCYRHVQGYRKHSVNYVIEHIKFLQKNYGIKGFQFCDELFYVTDKWVLDFCDAIEQNNLDIFYIIGGARVDFANEKILRRLKETGCIEIGFGQESGSDKILAEYKKGVTAKENIEKTLLAKKVGLNAPVQIVIGSPSEDALTIAETTELLKKVDACQYSLNYLIPLPGTPIWEYAMLNKLIPDVEKYLERIADVGGWRPVNLTKMPHRIWKEWPYVILREVKLDYAKKIKNIIIYVYYFLYLNRLFEYMGILFKDPEKFAKLFFKVFCKVKKCQG